MSKDIFISYSRRDQEFVTRLAGDLDAQVAGVWFDQSAIQAGEKWHDEIMEGINECKAFILILSPIFTCSKKYAANPSDLPVTGFMCPYGFSSLMVSSTRSLLGDEAIEYALSTVASSYLPVEVGRLRGRLRVT